MALGVDSSALEEVFDVRESTIRSWLCWSGQQGRKLHERMMVELELIHVQLANPRAPGGTVVALALAPADANVLSTLIIAQQGGMRFFNSQDAGASWRKIHFFPLSIDYNFNNLAVDPAHPRVVYAIGGTSLQRSTVGGETWQ